MNTQYEQLETLVNLMDNKFEVFGFRFGVAFIIDLVPGIGDIIATAIAVYIFTLALKFKIPNKTIVRMIFNILVYFIVGLIPLLGDILAAWWKPNKRNLKLLQRNIDQSLVNGYNTPA